MTDPPKIIRNNETLQSCYQQLTKNDIICGRIRLHPSEEPLLTDLVERGIKLIPSGTTQVLSKSKVFQVRLLADFMPANTLAIYNQHDLLRATSLYHQENISKVILKLDRKNGGLGVHLFDNIESLYNMAGDRGFGFPFVIQPFMEKARDIRVIILNNYTEAYERNNPYNFRNNLHCGAQPKPFTLCKTQLDFCKKVMKRGAFPYAHLDLILPAGETRECYLIEINLRGGLRGAQLTGSGYQQRTNKIHEMLLQKLLNKNTPSSK
ncbi:MAG: hypothetical protein GY702_13025 [Desulfobulbaceae bacterium]|nr:hypothetical protein [Desulfobulbaceae bacterium]